MNVNITELISFPVEASQDCDNSIDIRDSSGDVVCSRAIEHSVDDSDFAIMNFIANLINEKAKS